MSDRPNNGDVAQLPSAPIRSADALSKTLEGPQAPLALRTPTPIPTPNPAPPSTITSPRSAMLEAQRIGRYAVLRQLGEGGMGVVLAAYDEELDRRVAVKLLRDRSAQAEHRIRILREAQAMARVSHPNVVQVYEVGECVEPGSGESHIFIAMEFIDGSTLHDWQQQPGRTWEEILRVYLAAGQGLLAAHESGLVHRDFKPDNVLVGSDGRPRVADFGLARGGGAKSDDATVQPAEGAASRSGGHLLISPLTQHGTIMGTPMYMSPEQYKGEPAGPRSDQFSFCVALYEALYGVLPFEGDTFESLAISVLTGRIRPQPTGTPVPKPLAAAIMRGMAVAPEQRFPSMKELLAALSFDAAQNPAALPVIRRVFSGVLIALSVVLVSIFLGPILRKQNTVHQAMISALILFFGVSAATLLLRKMLLRNAFHRGIVFLILSLTGQEALISTVAFLTGMTVAQTVAMELAALVALSGSLTYFFFRRGWLIIPVVLLAMGYLVYSPQDAGLIAILLHVGCAGAAIWLWGRSAGAPGSLYQIASSRSTSASA